jgi:hypothetical protein
LPEPDAVKVARPVLRGAGRSNAPGLPGGSWHGAAPNRFMTHLAMVEVDDEGNAATWGEHVTDDEYNAGSTS